MDNCKKKMRLSESFFVLCLAWQNLVFEFVRAGFGKDHWDSNFNFHDSILVIWVVMSSFIMQPTRQARTCEEG